MYRLYNFVRYGPIRSFFSARTLVQTKLLNLLGLQLLRVIFAMVVYELRPLFNSRTAEPLVDQIRREGYATIPNFLSNTDFNLLQTLANSLENDHSAIKKIRQMGPNLSNVYFFENQDCSYSSFSLFAKNERLLQIMSDLERLNITKNLPLSRLELFYSNAIASDDKDRQTILHSDTFHHTYKAWLYLEDITTEETTFIYVPKSNRITLKRVWKEYLFSIQGHGSTMREICTDELRSMEMEEHIITAKKNTLVIADTLGYHRRNQCQGKTKRIALYARARTTPFMLWRS